MTSFDKLGKYGLAVVSGLAIAFAVQAQTTDQKTGMEDHMTGMQGQQMDNNDQQTWNTWLEERNKVVPASDILAGNLTSGFNAIGNVEELILNEEGNKLEYVLYESFWPPSIHGTGGFVYFDDIKLERGAGNNIDVRFDNEQDQQKSDTLELTAEEVKNRRVSRLIGDEVKFSDQELNIEDLFVDPTTGEVTHLIVDANQENLFGREFRAIPVDQVDFSQDQPTVNMQVSELGQQEQEYDPDLIILMLEGRN